MKKKIDDCLDGTISRIRHGSMYTCLMIECLSWYVCFSLLYSSAINAILRQYCATYKYRALSIYDLIYFIRYKLKIFIKNRSM